MFVWVLCYCLCHFFNLLSKWVFPWCIFLESIFFYIQYFFENGFINYLLWYMMETAMLLSLWSMYDLKSFSFQNIFLWVSVFWHSGYLLALTIPQKFCFTHPPFCFGLYVTVILYLLERYMPNDFWTLTTKHKLFKSQNLFQKWNIFF